MLCGCANPLERSTTSISGHVPSPPVSPLRDCFSVRVRPSSATRAVARGPGTSDNTQSEESLGLGAEAPPSTRSYTLTDGATNAIGRILTCFQDTESNSDDLPRSRPRSRSLWSRRRSPVSCTPASASRVAGGCIVDVVLDCSPGTARRRRLETQSLASTSSILHSDVASNASRSTSHGCEPTQPLSARSDEPVWERRQVQRGRRRLTEPTRPRPRGVEPPSAPAANIPSPPSQDTTATQHDRSRPPGTTSRTAGNAAPSGRPVTRRAATRAIPQPQVRVVQPTHSGGGGGGGQTENEDSVNT